ncbi:unnamed protein product, partial [Allacma fusca]
WTDGIADALGQVLCGMSCRHICD